MVGGVVKPRGFGAIGGGGGWSFGEGYGRAALRQVQYRITRLLFWRALIAELARQPRAFGGGSAESPMESLLAETERPRAFGV